MNIKHEKNHAGEFLLSEGNGKISREDVTIVSGDALESGQIVGVKTATNEYAPYSPGASDGTQVAAGILFAPLLASADSRHGVVIARLAEVSAERIVGCDAAAVADLKARNIIVR